MKNLQGDVIALYHWYSAAYCTLVCTYEYDPWGKLLSVKLSDGAEVAPTTYHVSNYNPFRYRGYYYDNGTNLYYLQSRYYDPQIGRFLNADVFASTGQDFIGYNMFAYCANNPINFVDMSGSNATLVQSWMGTMGWLCVVDGPIPIGDVVFVAGIVILGIIAIEENTPKQVNSSPAVEITPVTCSPSFTADWDEDEDYYDDDSNFGGREKIGENKGNAPRDNKKQNKQFDDAAGDLSKDIREMMHRDSSDQGYGYHDLVKLAQDYRYFYGK